MDLFEPLRFAFMQDALLAGSVIAAMCAMLSCFLILKGWSLMGDAISHAVLPGTIQVPSNGQPIVLMSDAQTTGGYPRIGVVIAADLWKLAQVRLGGAVRFVRSTREEARYALAEQQAYLRQIDAAIAMHEERMQRLAGRAHTA